MICAKRASWPASSATALVAFAAVILMLVAPVAALDRLLMVGGDALRNWLDQACNTVGTMDLNQLDLLRQRVLALQAGVDAQSKSAQENLDKAFEEWRKAGGTQVMVGHMPGPMHPPSPKVDEAGALLQKARDDSLLVHENLPAVLDCIEEVKAHLTKAESPAPIAPPVPAGPAVQCKLVGGSQKGIVISTPPNTPCVLDIAALWDAKLPGSYSQVHAATVTGIFSDVRIAMPPEHGTAEWSNGALTYRPEKDYGADQQRGDSLKLSQPSTDLIDGQLVANGRRDIIDVEVFVGLAPSTKPHSPAWQ